MTQVTLLDGGMGQELVHRAGDNPTPLWSTQVMIDHPGMVAQVHRDFMAAGATVATTNTYAIHHDRLRNAGVPEKFHELHRLALQEAQDSGAKRIGGSIGPLVASYQPTLHPPHEEAVPLYAEVAKQLAPVCDMILCETVASVAHARAILEGAAEAGLPVWLAVTVDDEDGTVLRSGEPVADVLKLDGYEALLANCSAPEVIPQALDVLARSGKPYGAYANGFTQITKDFLKANPTVDALSKRRDFTPEVYADHVISWVDAGATIVGGCCEVGPSHIQAIAERLTAAGHEIV